MGFDVADDDSHALALGALGGAKHGVGLADACGHAKEDLEFATLCGRVAFLDCSQQGIWIRANVLSHEGNVIDSRPKVILNSTFSVGRAERKRDSNSFTEKK